MIELFKDSKGYTIRKGILRNGCYLDTLTNEDLWELKKKIEKVFDKITRKYYGGGGGGDNPKCKCGHILYKGETYEYDGKDYCSFKCLNKNKILTPDLQEPPMLFDLKAISPKKAKEWLRNNK